MSNEVTELKASTIPEAELSWTKLTVERDGEPALTFTGVQIASARSFGDRGHPDFSGSTGRWTVLKLYRTKGGKLVAERIERTQWQGEEDQHEGIVCETEPEIVEFFGHGRLAKQLYSEAEITTAINVA
ncbi:MAG: hypothetical protein O9256_00195 [Rhizobiaceae bacterium]|nr:hypothetical protein [Rhizobiaceae bacterium]MCZ8351199.1 hypothetical protein [Rhizobium sp.]